MQKPPTEYQNHSVDYNIMAFGISCQYRGVFKKVSRTVLIAKRLHQ